MQRLHQLCIAAHDRLELGEHGANDSRRSGGQRQLLGSQQPGCSGDDMQAAVCAFTRARQQARVSAQRRRRHPKAGLAPVAASCFISVVVLHVLMVMMYRIMDARRLGVKN